jgi:outer membrane beta-barrel protein
MRWQVTAVSLALGLGWWCAAPARAEAPNASPAAASSTTADADLQKEAGDDGAQKNVDAGTGKTLQERIRAVSRRTFLKANRFELAPSVGITTSDAFFRSWAFGTRGSWHFSEEFSLDFGGAYAPIQEPLDVFRVLNVDPADLDLKSVATTSLVAYVDAGVTFSPFYGKVALASELVGHFDVFLSSGVGAVFDSSPQVVHPALEVGIGSHLYLNRWLTLRADVRDYVYPADASGELAVSNLLLVNVGLGFFFPLDFDYAAETLGAKD